MAEDKEMKIHYVQIGIDLHDEEGVTLEYREKGGVDIYNYADTELLKRKKYSQEREQIEEIAYIMTGLCDLVNRDFNGDKLDTSHEEIMEDLKSVREILFGDKI